MASVNRGARRAGLSWAEQIYESHSTGFQRVFGTKVKQLNKPGQSTESDSEAKSKRAFSGLGPGRGCVPRPRVGNPQMCKLNIEKYLLIVRSKRTFYCIQGWLGELRVNAEFRFSTS